MLRKGEGGQVWSGKGNQPCPDNGMVYMGHVGMALKRA